MSLKVILIDAGVVVIIALFFLKLCFVWLLPDVNEDGSMCMQAEKIADELKEQGSEDNGDQSNDGNLQDGNWEEVESTLPDAEMNE